MSMANYNNKNTENKSETDLKPKKSAHLRPVVKGESAVKTYFKVTLSEGRTFVAANQSTYILDTSKGTKEGAAKKIQLAPMAVYPVKVLTGQNGTYVKLGFQSVIGEEKELTVPMEAISSGNKVELKGLATHGIPVGSKSKLLEPLTEAISRAVSNQSIKVDQGQEFSGWSADLETHVMPGDELYAGEIDPVIAKAGCPDEWKEIMQEAFAKSPITTFVVACAIGGFMRGLVPTDHTGIVHLHGDSSQGKSLSERFAASFIGDPGLTPGKPGLVYDWSSSRVGIENMLTANTGGFLCMDEVHSLTNSMAPQVATAFFMYITNGGGRGVGRKDGGMRNVKFWNSTVLSNGNRALTNVADGSAQHTALVGRTIEVDVDTHEIWPGVSFKEVKSLMKRLNHNYGHGYELVIDYIKNNRADLINIFEEADEDIGSKVHLKHYSRQAQNWALAIAGCEIIEGIFGKDAAMGAKQFIDQRVHLMIGESANAKVHKLDDLRSRISSIILENLQRFKFQGSLYSDMDTDNENQGATAKNHSNNVKASGLVGYVDQIRDMKNEGDFHGRVYFLKSVADKFSSWDFVTLYDEAKRAGITVTDSTEKDPYRKTKKYKGVNCYCFDLTKLPAFDDGSKVDPEFNVDDIKPEDIPF